MVVAAILPISAFLLCFIHKVRGSRGCVNHIRVLVFALYKKYVVVAVVLNISAHSICFIQKVQVVVVAAILPISAFLLCFIHKVRGSRGCGNHSRVLLCFIQKVCGSRGCITYVRVLYFVLYKTYRVSALTSYISATYHIFNTKGLHELQLYLRIAFPFSIQKPPAHRCITRNLLFLYTERPWTHLQTHLNLLLFI